VEHHHHLLETAGVEDELPLITGGDEREAGTGADERKVGTI
jgi:hypothetical protein